MSRYHKGLSDYELDRKHVGSRMQSALSGSRNERNRKWRVIDATLGQAMDARAGRNKTVEPEEYKQAMDDLQQNGIISEHERAKLDQVVEKDLND